MEEIIQNIGYTSKEDFELLKLMKAPYSILRGEKQDVLYIHECLKIGDVRHLYRVLDHEKAELYTRHEKKKSIQRRGYCQYQFPQIRANRLFKVE